jgi:hypothetical protein
MKTPPTSFQPRASEKSATRLRSASSVNVGSNLNGAVEVEDSVADAIVVSAASLAVAAPSFADYSSKLQAAEASELSITTISHTKIQDQVAFVPA